MTCFRRFWFKESPVLQKTFLTKKHDFYGFFFNQDPLLAGHEIVQKKRRSIATFSGELFYASTVLSTEPHCILAS